jgi:hypothetical protein
MLVAAVGLGVAVFWSGCENGGNGGGLNLLGQEKGTQEWTICCMRTQVHNHQQICQSMANLLGKVDGLDPGKVRVKTTPSSSAIYYGSYYKVQDRDSDRLVFPPEYREDIKLIRSLTYNRSNPFFGAQPEVVGGGPKSTYHKWNVYNAKGDYTLHIAIFYNTGSFQQRKEAARQYVEALRQEGFNAYFWHGVVKSHVFVGDFYEKDVVHTAEGARFGERVEKFVEEHEEEFKYATENGVIRKRTTPEGEKVAPLSRLVAVPQQPGDARKWEQ